jgi:glycosyltransferase involved in cell wall biosynthesis
MTDLRNAAAAAPRLRVGVVAPPWLPVPPFAYGGTESMVDLLARGLAADGHDVRLVCHPDSTCPVRRICPDITLRPELIGNAIAELRHTAAAYELLQDVDVVHDHTLLGPLIVGKDGLGPPAHVVTHHGPFDEATTPVFRVVAQRAAVVAISRSQAAGAEGVPITEVVHHGIDVHEVPVGDGRGGYAVHLARMAPEKGADAAIRIARAAGVPIRIAAKIHEPAEQEFFESCVRPLLGKDAEYVGEAGPEDKYALLGEAVALLNPITWPEPFGLNMVEALAAGTPVVAYASGASPEIVEHGANGFLVASDNEAALADALSEVASLSRATCRATAVERFSVERMVRDYVALYRRLLDQRSEGPGLARGTSAAT